MQSNFMYKFNDFMSVVQFVHKGYLLIALLFISISQISYQNIVNTEETFP